MSEKEGLNQKIATNSEFDFKSNYTCLKIAGVIKEGALKQEYLVENGFRQPILFLMNSENAPGKKPNQGLKTFLNLQLRDQESCFFYKKTISLQSFFK